MNPFISMLLSIKKEKNTSRIYRKLGKLSVLSRELITDRDGVMTWAKEQARIETNDNVKIKFTKMDRLFFTNLDRII